MNDNCESITDNHIDVLKMDAASKQVDDIEI